MSLVTTLHIQVRQKGRFGDKYLGYFPLCPGNFKVNPNSVTHWYKLGTKPGKSSSKLRGDLKLSFQFLSKWSESNSGPGESDSGMQHGLLLQRASSDRKLWNGNGIGPDSDSMLVDKHRQQTFKNKKEILSTLRRSFKRKSKSSSSAGSSGRGAQKSNEFLFSGGEVSPLPPETLAKRSSTISMAMKSGGGASSGARRPASLGMLTDSEDSLDSSPLMSRVRGRGSDSAMLEAKTSSNDGGVAGERDAASPLSSSASESKLVSMCTERGCGFNSPN